MDRKKHICLIYEFLSEQGGLEREIITHSKFLQEAGYEVKVLTCHFDKTILEQLPFEDIQIEEISTIKTNYEWINMALCFLGFNKLKKYNPSAFLSYSAPCNFLIRNKKNKKINYVNHFPHYIYLNLKERFEWAYATQGVKRMVVFVASLILGAHMKKLDKKFLRKNKLIFMNSKYTKKRLEKLYNIKNTIVSYPPLDKRFENPKVKNEIKESYVFSSSRIIPDKKYEWLIKSMNFMKNKLPLYLAGSVEEGYKNKLLNLAKGKNVKVKFLGRLNTEKIIEYYASAKVFALPTPGEDFGLVPAESLACGTPVVVWGDGAGPTEQIIDGVNGFYAKPYDFKDFAAKVDKVIDTKLKQKNKKKIISSAKEFSYSEVKKNFLKEINDIIF